MSRLPRPGGSVADDPLLAVLRDGARRMLMQAIEAEVEGFLAAHAELVDEHGRRRVVRNGHAPEREIQTGIGPIAVRRPQGPRPWRRRRPRHPVHLGGAAGLSAPDQERRGAVALALPEGHLDRPVRGGAGGAARGRCARPVGDDRAPPDGCLAGRARALAGARSLGPALRLRLGRRGLLHAAARARPAVHPGPDRRRRAAAARSCWRSRTASGRAPRAGASCCSGCATRTGSCSIPSSPPATVRSASGRRCTRSGRRPGSSAAGFTRRPTC